MNSYLVLDQHKDNFFVLYEAQHRYILTLYDTSLGAHTFPIKFFPVLPGFDFYETLNISFSTFWENLTGYIMKITGQYFLKFIHKCPIVT